MNIPSQADAPVHIVQLTDFHLLANPELGMMGIDTEESFASVVEAVRSEREGIDLFLLTGDLAQDPVADVYRRLKPRLQALPAPCHCLPGNHDEPAMIRDILADDSIFAQPRILLDRWQIVLLDSTIPDDPGGCLPEPELETLERLLAERPDLHTLICLHHSPLPTGAEWLDTMMLSNADRLAAVIAPYPLAKTVVCGHVHQAMDRMWGTVRLLSCPSTCFQFKPLSKSFALDALPPGYRWLKLYPDGRVETEVVRTAFLPKGLDMSSGGY
jgi:Icc protein